MSRAESRCPTTSMSGSTTHSVLEERGEVDVKGKGVMHTWYLVGRRNDEAIRHPVEHRAAAGSA